MCQKRAGDECVDPSWARALHACCIQRTPADARGCVGSSWRPTGSGSVTSAMSFISASTLTLGGCDNRRKMRLGRKGEGHSHSVAYPAQETYAKEPRLGELHEKLGNVWRPDQRLAGVVQFGRKNGMLEWKLQWRRMRKTKKKKVKRENAELRCATDMLQVRQGVARVERAATGALVGRDGGASTLRRLGNLAHVDQLRGEKDECYRSALPSFRSHAKEGNETFRVLFSPTAASASTSLFSTRHGQRTSGA